MKSNQEYSASFTGSNISGSSTAPSNLPKLGPTWRSGSQGSRTFQPPPPVADADAAKIIDQQQSSNRNTYSALIMDMDDDEINLERDDSSPSNISQPNISSRSGSGGGGNSSTASFISRSEALRSATNTGYSRSVSVGERNLSSSIGRGSGRSLRELASMIPNTTAATMTGPGGTGRVTRGTSLTFASGLEDTARSSSSLLSSLEQDSKKVIRYTREKLLSMRPRPSIDKEISSHLKGGDGSFWFSKECLDPGKVYKQYLSRLI